MPERTAPRSRLTRLAASKRARIVLTAAVFATAAAGGSRLAGEEKAHADNPNFIPPHHPAIVEPTGPEPVAPLPGLANPQVTPHDEAPRTPEPVVPVEEVQERIIQLLTKVRFDANRNGQFDSQDPGIMLGFITWHDVNGNEFRDSGEQFAEGRTDQNGVRILHLSGVVDGQQVCTALWAPPNDLIIVIDQDCFTVRGSFAEGRLLVANAEEVARTPEPEAQPEVGGTTVPTTPNEVTESAAVTEPEVEEPRVVTCPDGHSHTLPEEFQAQLRGQDEETIARMIEEFKGQFICHDVRTAEEHQELGGQIEDHDEATRDAHQTQDDAHGRQEGALGVLAEDHKDQDTAHEAQENAHEDQANRLGAVEDGLENVADDVKDVPKGPDWVTRGLAIGIAAVIGSTAIRAGWFWRRRHTGQRTGGQPPMGGARPHH